MRHFKICPSLFSPAELLVPHVHIVQCIACSMMQTDERLKITIDHQFVIWISHWSWIYILNFNGLIFVASPCQGALPIWNPLVLLTLWRGNVTCTSILFPFGIWMQIPRQVAQNQKSNAALFPLAKHCLFDCSVCEHCVNYTELPRVSWFRIVRN